MKKVICFLANVDGILYNNVDFKELVKLAQEDQSLSATELYESEGGFFAVLENGAVVAQPIDIKLVKLPINDPQGF